MITAMLKPAYDAFYRSFLQVRTALSVPCRRLDKKWKSTRYLDAIWPTPNLLW